MNELLKRRTQNEEINPLSAPAPSVLLTFFITVKHTCNMQKQYTARLMLLGMCRMVRITWSKSLTGVHGMGETRQQTFPRCSYTTINGGSKDTPFFRRLS